MDMSSSAPLGHQRARIPVAGRLVALTAVLAGGVATWGWLGHWHAPPATAPQPEARAAPLSAAPAAPARVATAAAAAAPAPNAAPTQKQPTQKQPAQEQAARHVTAAAEISALARQAGQPRPAPALPGIANAEAARSSPAAPASAAPSFDIVRVSPHGQAVIAGRSEPGAQVVVAANGRPIARAHADAQGQWVALPASPLPAGGQQLTLSTIPEKPGEIARHGAAPVIVLVPDAKVPGAKAPGAKAPGAKPAPQSAVALLAPATGPPRLLQIPPRSGTQATGPPRLGLGIVDYDKHGDIRFAGTAPPHSTVRMYIDRHAVGDATADAQGQWTLVPAAPVAEGRHQLRTDQLRPNGSVAARIALPFERVAMPDTEILDGKVVIQPGDDLWRIARHVYGRGIRYTVIYLANRSQIRNPDLIYPGQVFAVPTPSADDSANPAPVSSSRSE